MKAYTDEQLVAHYLKGDEEALENLIKRYLKPIYSFTFRFVRNSQETEDITQNVFVKVWKNLKKFDQKKKFKTWIFAIAKNTCFDWQKKKKTLPLYFAETIRDPSPILNEPLDRILERLSPKYRMVLFLRYNDHFTFREIAESLGESIDTIKTRHRRGIAILRKLLNEPKQLPQS